MPLDKDQLIPGVEHYWNQRILPTLQRYIEIPNVSPAFDKDWQANGYIDSAVSLVVDWCKDQAIQGLSLSVERIENRTPLLFMEVAPTDPSDNKTVLLYGHLDKQPAMTGWDDDKDPWKPVIKEDKLYGRGGADDGYAIFTAITAIRMLQEQKLPHARCVIIIESSEEGGSIDLPAYFDKLGDRIGTPELIICLDSGCGNYEQLWLTTSLRGNIVGNLTVRLLREGIHSGNGGGAVASSFRVMRILLDRLENAETGQLNIDALQARIPEERQTQARIASQLLNYGENSFPLLEGVSTVFEDPFELILNRTWRPSLSYIGAGGFPKPEDAGNVLRPETQLKLSLRIPPTVDSAEIGKQMKALLEADPPYSAHVDYELIDGTDGWNAPAFGPWLNEALQSASMTYFGKQPVFMGEGGSIPFMGLLSRKYPDAQFMVTGVLGPLSNAHGPNEFLHLPMVKKVTCCVAHVLARQSGEG